MICGAGPAGLTAAYLLTRAGHPVTVLEADRLVGGLARTVEHQGYRFDIGGHRFFTQLPVVQALWEELLDGQMIAVPRLSRIYYKGVTSNTPCSWSMPCRGSGRSNAPESS